MPHPSPPRLRAPLTSLPLLGALSGLALAALGAASVAAGDPAGHYHPNDIAAASKVFATAAEAVGPRYDTAARALQRVGRGLELLELGALTLGDRAPEGLLDWMATTRRQATGEHLRLQRHVDLMGEDYSSEFGEAMQRVLAKQGAGLVECGATGIAAMVGGKNCPGEDANARIASAIDADPALQAAIASIGAIDWPIVSTPNRTWPVVALTGTDQWVQVGALLSALFPDRLQDHQDDLDRALSAILEDDSRSKEDQLAAAEVERQKYADALAADGAVIFAAMRDSLEKGAKKGAPAAVGLCANAPALGGCPGEDVTKAVVGFLRDDKKFVKATYGLR